MRVTSVAVLLIVGALTLTLASKHDPLGMKSRFMQRDDSVMVKVPAELREAYLEELGAFRQTDPASMRALIDTIEPLGFSEAWTMRPLNATPQQLHLSVTPTTGNVSIIWLTSTASNASTVCFAPRGAPLQNYTCVNGTVWTYNPISVIPWTGTIHGAHMVGLIPSHHYDYYVGDPFLGVWSNVVTFRCPDLRPTHLHQGERDENGNEMQERELYIAVGGDMGTVQLVGHYVAAQMLRDDSSLRFGQHFDAFWLIGDISYSTLDPPKLSFEFFWDMFLQQEEALANHVPLLVSYGNHDFAGGDSGAFINRFRMPSGHGGLGNFYWAYEHGPILYVSMCTEVGLDPVLCDYAPGSPQYKWLEHQFATINRTRTPWLILGSHRPMYSSDKSTDSGPLREFIEPLLIKYKVDVELSGHMHCTELVAPVANLVPNMTGVTQTAPSAWRFDSPQAPVHLTTGTLGAVIREKFEDPSPPWSLFHSGGFWDDAYGYVVMKANRSALEFNMYRTLTNETLWSLVMSK